MSNPYHKDSNNDIWGSIEIKTDDRPIRIVFSDQDFQLTFSNVSRQHKLSNLEDMNEISAHNGQSR